MQVAANEQVEFVSEAHIDDATKDAELQAELQKEDLQSKPENMRPKIAQGRVDKALREKCLLSQSYIRETSKTVEQVVKEAIAEIGENIKVRRFVRYELGAGIETGGGDDFATEVKKQMGQA